jgi:hypothetical protein
MFRATSHLACEAQNMPDPVSDRVDRILSEGPIGASEAARLLGVFRGGRPTHPSTPVRWMLSGVQLPDGRRIKLEHIRVANRLMTSRAALIRFLAAQQDPGSTPMIEPPRSPAECRRSNARAEAELERMGVK